MTIPFIAIRMKKALEETSRDQFICSLSLGITKGYTIIKLVILNALKYIMTSLGIGVVFAMGATAPVMFTGAVIIAGVGPSGCGKSTFLKSLNRTVEEYGGKIEGKITLDNVNIMDMPLQKLRNSIGMVFQTPVVFPFFIYKNMAYAPIYYGEKSKEKLYETVIKNLKKSGLYDEVKDNLNMQASKLSGGQQQRLVIARCLTVNPEIILLDEPCSALDIKNTAHIEKMLLELKNEYTIIIVTHNLAQAKRIADRVVFMDDGNIIEMGTTDEIFNHPVDTRTQEYIDYMKN